jgi:tetraacyldisaccharide 4'-kinase
LREPAGVLSRAGLIVITRADELAPEQLRALRGRVERLSGGRPVALAVHRPQCLSDGDGARLDLAQLHGKKICAFCGIGNPDSFFATLERAGASVVEKVAFDDHAQYSPAELEHVIRAAQNWQADAVVTTAKDRVKLDGRLFARPLWTLQVCMELTEGQELLERALDSALAK